MLYVAFGFLAVGVAALVLGFANGTSGLGTLTNVAFLMGLVFLAVAIAIGYRHRHRFRRNAHR
jgi:hydrogenase/urease accessory protein HupE